MIIMDNLKIICIKQEVGLPISYRALSEKSSKTRLLVHVVNLLKIEAEKGMDNSISS